MADRRKSRKKKETELKDGEPKPSKEEYAVAKYMRKKLPEKKTTLLGHKVDYFISSKAIDCLLDSPWATKTGKTEILFTTRESVVEFMDRMLEHKFFHRAKKIVVQKDGKKKKKESDENADSSKEKEMKKVKGKNEIEEKESKKGKGKNESDEKEIKKGKGKNESDEKEIKKGKGKNESDEKGIKKGKGKMESEEKVDEKKEGDGLVKKKEKKKIKLDIHMKQIFSDGNEAYVWIYDPIPVRTWIIGTLMVIGAVLVCLFPLWPRTIRHYIYYLSISAAGFLVFIIGLAVVRLIVFVVIWLATFGKHHLWFLPNLTEDVGFFESFWPLYKYEYKGSKNKTTKEKDEEKSKDSTSIEENKDNEKSDSSSDQEGKVDQIHSESEQESEAEKVKADNGENGFEIVDAEEMDQYEEEKKKISDDDD